MKNCLKPIMMAVVAIAMISSQDYVVAQSRRSSSSSSSRSSSTTASSSRSSAARSGGGYSSSARSSGTRQSASPSSSYSGQSRRASGSSVSRSSSSGVSRSSASSSYRSSASGSYRSSASGVSRSTSSGRVTAQSPSVRTQASPGVSSGTASARSSYSSPARSGNRPGISASQAARSSGFATSSQAAGARTASASRSGNTGRGIVSRESADNVRHAAGTLNPVSRSRDIGPRIPPRERMVMSYDRPGRFCGHAPHYFGYRVSYLPPEFVHVSYWGRSYCCYNGIYYRPWGTYYVVCRPPFGVVFDWVVGDIARAAVTFAYYSNVCRTYSIIDENYNTILEQNKIIAQNNATIAAQNSQIEQGARRAEASYALASNMELVQSYADASVEYFYEDGVFFTKGADGKYVTIVPPVGALVSTLPDDYEIFPVDGVEYYKVDDTIYKLSVIDATPYFEVVGQLTGEKAAKYDAYK